MKRTVLFWVLLGLVAGIPVDRAMAQMALGAEAKGASALLSEAGTATQDNEQGILQSIDRKSPRATVASFVAAMTSIPTPNYDQAYECMAFASVASVTKATKQRLANDLFRIIGHVDDPTLAANIAYYPPKGATTVGYWTFFPRPGKGRDAIPVTTAGGVPAKSGAVTQGKTMTDRKAYEALIRASGRYRVQLARDDQTGAWRFIVGPETAELALLLSGSPWMSPGLKGATGNLTMTVGERIQWSMPLWLLDKTLGWRLWQWFGIAILLCIGVLLDLLVQLLIRQSARVIRPIQDTVIHATTLNRAAWPTGLAVAAIFWWITVHWLALPPASASVVSLLITIFAVYCSVWAGFRIADLAGEVAERKAEQEKSVIEDLTVPIVRKTIKLAIVGVALVVIAWELGASSNTILAALGIVGAGVMLASRDVIAHYFGSITLVSAKPFDVGDWVIIDGVEGTVEELGFRATKIRTFSNSEVTIPNSNLIQANIDNYGRRKYRRWKTFLSLPFETPPDRVEAFCEGIRELVRIHPATRKDYYQVWLNEFGADSLQVLLYIFFETPDWESELRERNRMALDIMRLADYLDLRFSIPSQAIQFEETPKGAERSTEDVTTGLGAGKRNEADRPLRPGAPVEAVARMSGRESAQGSAGDAPGEKAERAGRAAAAAITEGAPWRTRD